MKNLSEKATIALLTSVLLIFLGSAFPVTAVAEKGFRPFLIAEPLSVSNPGIAPFTPPQIWKAYNFTPLLNAGFKGSGQVIAIVDAYGSGSITTDVATFSSKFKLPACNLKIYYPNGRPFFRDSGWAIETSLDVEWAHAIAPQATVALVVAYDASFQRIYNAVNYAINNVPGVTALSMSFGALETDYPTKGPTIVAFHSLFDTATSKNITLFASSGDNGATTANDTIYPATDPLVTAVGGTSLYLNSDGSYKSETTWSGSGGGASTVFAEPSYQTAVGDSKRDVADVAYDANPNTGFYVYYNRYWYMVGGTSVGAPQWAGLFAIAVQYHGHNFTNANVQLYSLSVTVYHDITTGSNGYYTAGLGWDYPTGWGTPDVYQVVKNLP